MKPFMSAAPRPYRRPSRATQVEGIAQTWPSTGTTSVWPDSTSPAPSAGPTLANRLALVPAGAEYQLGGDAEPVEIVAHELDQGQVGVAVGGFEPDQPIEHLAHVEQGLSRHHFLATCTPQRPRGI